MKDEQKISWHRIYCRNAKNIFWKSFKHTKSKASCLKASLRVPLIPVLVPFGAFAETAYHVHHRHPISNASISAAIAKLNTLDSKTTYELAMSISTLRTSFHSSKLQEALKKIRRDTDETIAYMENKHKVRMIFSEKKKPAPSLHSDNCIEIEIFDKHYTLPVDFYEDMMATTKNYISAEVKPQLYYQIHENIVNLLTDYMNNPVHAGCKLQLAIIKKISCAKTLKEQENGMQPNLRPWNR